MTLKLFIGTKTQIYIKYLIRIGKENKSSMYRNYKIFHKKSICFLKCV